MSALGWTLLLLLGVALVVAPQFGSVLGRKRGLWVGAAVLGAFGGAWALLDRSAARLAPTSWAGVPSSPSDSCQKCHADHYESWHRTYHRTMTREATPENVRGDFADAVHDYQGLRTRFFREGDAYVMETIDPDWALSRARAGEAAHSVPPPRHARYRVDRLVGSHWLQECLHRQPNGRYIRLPVLYHIAERRWVHTNGAFLAPDTDDFWQKSRAATWNDTCLYCHNTGPSKNPVRDPRGQVSEFKSTVAELGIACEACHGPGGEHVRRNHNPARRFDLQQSRDGDASIVNPLRLSVPRRDEICARCHGALVPRVEAWDLVSQRDPFVPGMDLARINFFFRSEAEQAGFAKRSRAQSDPPIPPTPTDGRFWGDGTPLTTALEYNGMALSACYQKGQGTMSCLSCHEMHPGDPNHMLTPGMRSNEACFQCHDSYRERLTEHTRHPADSPGSQCFSCHMPHQVYSLLTTHRSHRIENPTIEGSLGTGKPHACNLCHLDKSLGWTRDELARWPAATRKRPVLSEDEERVSAALLWLARGDARTRVVVIGAFSEPAARRAAGTEWFGPFVTRLLEHERYPAVRYLGHRALLAVHGESRAGPFDYLGRPATRLEQLRALRERFDADPVRGRYDFLPLTPRGLPDEAVLRRLLELRTDPDLTINE